MGKTSVRQNTPISLPYDGPIWNVLKSQSDEEQKESDAPYLISAARLCTECASCDSIVRQLVQKQVNATSIRDQLHQLQAFRSMLLQKYKKQQLNACVDFAALYRLFLEWSVSAQSPATLRRALHANISTLVECELVSYDSIYQIHTSVLSSICEEHEAQLVWTSPLHSLQELLTCQAVLDLVGENTVYLLVILQYLARMSKFLTNIIRSRSATKREESTILLWDSELLTSLDEATKLLNLVKLLIQYAPQELATFIVPINSLRDFAWLILSCAAVPPDNLPVAGVAFGRTALWGVKDETKRLIQILSDCRIQLAELARTVCMQGLAATASNEALLNDTGDYRQEVPLQLFINEFQSLALEASDHDVRLTALKAIRTLLSRCRTIYEAEGEVEFTWSPMFMRLAEDALELALECWENPPSRKFGNSIAVLFESIVAFFQVLGNGLSFGALVERLLNQPPNRKGRYLALEKLLPITGARQLINAAGSRNLVDDLLRGIGDRGSNVAAIADLWATLLRTYHLEIVSSDKDTNGGVSISPSDKEYHRLLSPTWIDSWIPGLARALVDEDVGRRRQVAAFCLPRIVETFGLTKKLGAHAFQLLLEEVQLVGEASKFEKLLPPSKERETFDDRVLWAKLDITRHASEQSLLQDTLSEYVSEVVELQEFLNALCHSSQHIRLVAFQQTNSIISCHWKDESPLFQLEKEAEYWKVALHFAIKSDTKEYVTSIILCLLALLDRLSGIEAGEIVNPDATRDLNDECLLRRTFSFVVDFLLGDLFVRYAAYPGGVPDKENFALALVECVLVFCSRDNQSLFASKMIPRTGPVFQRRVNEKEKYTAGLIRRALFEQSTLSALLSLLHSSWDSNRSKASQALNNLLLMAKEYNLQLPDAFSSAKARLLIEARGVFLASSPRQRESDTGSRILVFAYLSSACEIDRLTFLTRLIDLLETRLKHMTEQLEVLLTHRSQGDDELVLTHGLVKAIEAIIRQDEEMGRENVKRGEWADLMARLTSLLFKSIQVSLTVVADIREGTRLDGVEEEILDALKVKNIPNGDRRINPGAIGANGIFSSVSRIDATENKRRLTSQRVVIGSWLLTKETCSAIATTLSRTSQGLDESASRTAGLLLISTLTSLKHTGAAFAAHKALQEISTFYLRQGDKPNIRNLPAEWSRRLLAEVSDPERVRNSTLRRSTGFALGFLSLMRSEVNTMQMPRPLCRFVLSQLLRLAFPPKEIMQSFFEGIGLHGGENSCLPFLQGGSDSPFVSYGNYQLKTRLHALNILRLIILDAPLAQEVAPVVGDALVCTIMGYTDTEWSIRNSSTMVFAAIMLRTIDADKNAANKDMTSGSAITLVELFRSYPSLPRFLLGVMEATMNGHIVTRQGLSLPPVMPILLLLSRVQPVAGTGSDAITQAAPFIPVILQCLGHEHLVVRETASRALVTLLPLDSEFQKIFTSLMQEFRSVDELPDERRAKSWNLLHGVLLAVRELSKASESAAANVINCTILSGLKWFKCGNLNAPLPCIGAAIEAFSSAGLKGHAEKLCQEFMFWEQYLAESNNVGFGSTSMIVGSTAMKSFCDDLWIKGRLNPGNEWNRLLQRIRLLMESPNFDIRCAAVKAFKKGICHGIDRATTDFDCAHILDLTNLVKGALFTSLKRNGKEGVHQPTVRRLSRCLLECLQLGIRIGDTSCSQYNSYLSDISETMVNDMRRSNDGDNSCVGNAMELWSFSVRRNLNSLKEVDKFVANVLPMCSPDNGWRVRHSAATAMQLSCLLGSQVEVWNTLIELMQDADQDVRYAAAKAFSNYYDESFERIIPELMLVKVYTHMQCPQLCIAESLKRLEIASHDLVDSMKALCEEMQLSENSASPEQIKNQEFNRRIFEEEDKNSYRESMLLDQLHVLSLLQAETPFPDDVYEHGALLVLRLKQSVRILRNRVEKGADFAHNITWHKKIFPSLHGLLLTCAALFYQSTSLDDVDIRQMATAILNINPSSMHPCMADALLSVAKSQYRDASTCKQIRQFCFLIPNVPQIL